MEEKKGGIRTLSGVSTTFNKLIEELHLVDVHTPNGFYTWQNKSLGMRHIASRLDRFLVSKMVLTGEGDLGASMIPGVGSYHWPICLEWERLGEFVKKPFRFEKF